MSLTYTEDMPNIEPITRKEMFLAKAGGLNAETLEPITREEYFLSKIQNGSCGVTSWNELTDKPFGEVEVLKEVFPETVLEMTSSAQGIYAILSVEPIPTVPLKANETYVWKLDGKEYVCNSGAYGIDVGYSCVLIGNHEISLGVGDADKSYSNPDCPFWCMYTEDGGDGNPHMVILTNFDATGSTLSIYHVTTEVKKIDAKYLPLDEILGGD